MIHDDVKNILRHQHYHLVGRHSAVKPCLWLKKALRGEGFCYKQKFYGIESHRCMQMTPAVSWCTHACIFCWRNTEHTLGQELEEFDDPEFIVDESLKAHKQAISGFGGTGDVDKKLLDEAKKPNQVAISLSGEPLTYPEMGSLISEFKKKNMTVYLVTNGTMPERLAALTELPTNLYLSVVAPDKVTHSRVCAPLISNAWENIIKSIELMPSFGTRTVVRVTAVKGVNMLNPKGYAKIIERAQPDHIEVKAFMFVGGSRNRLSMDNMPSHSEVKDFARQIGDEISYELKDEKMESRVVLMSKK